MCLSYSAVAVENSVTKATYGGRVYLGPTVSEVQEIYRHHGGEPGSRQDRHLEQQLRAHIKKNYFEIIITSSPPPRFPFLPSNPSMCALHPPYQELTS